MNNIEKQLNKLPNFKLSNKARLKFYWNLNKKIINNIFHMKVLKYTLSGVAVFAVLLGGSATYAYNSVTVTKGDLLFSLKSGVEATELAMASKGVEKVQTNLKMADRRMAEAKFLAVEGEFNSASSKVSLINVAHAQNTVVDTTNVITETVNAAIASMEAAIAEANTITNPTDLSTALGAIEVAQSVQVVDLLTIAEDVSAVDSNTATVVASAIADTQDNLATVTDAIATVDKAVVAGDEEIDLEIEAVRERRKREPVTQADAQEALDEFLANKAEIEAKILEKIQDPIKAQEMIDRLNKIEAQVTQAIADGNYNKAKGLVKASNTISDNIEHFAEKREELKDKREEKRDEWKKKRKELKDEYEAKTEERIQKINELKAQFDALSNDEKAVRIDEFKQKLETIKDEAEQNREDIKDKAEQKREDLKDKAEQKREDLKDKVEQKREDLKDKVEQKREDLKDRAEKARELRKEKREAKESAESKEATEPKEAVEPKEAAEEKEAVEPKEAAEPKEALEPKESE